MPYDELQATLTIAKMQGEDRQLRQQLQQALQRCHRLAEENEQLRKRLEQLEREAARQAARFRRRERNRTNDGCPFPDLIRPALTGSASTLSWRSPIDI